MGKRVKALAILLAFMKVISSIFVKSNKGFAQIQYLENGGFEANFWNDRSWTVATMNWNTLDVQHYSYSNDSWMIPNDGNYGFKYWIKDSAIDIQSFTLSQTIPTLPAGSYV